MKARILAALACFPMLTAGMCSTTGQSEPHVVIQRVEIPVPVSCLVHLDPRPLYPDTKEALRAAAPDIDKQVGLLLAGQGLRDAWEDQAEAALKGCELPSH